MPANREGYELIRDGIPVEFEDAKGRPQRERVHVIDVKKVLEEVRDEHLPPTCDRTLFKTNGDEAFGLVLDDATQGRN